MAVFMQVGAGVYSSLQIQSCTSTCWQVSVQIIGTLVDVKDQCMGYGSCIHHQDQEFWAACLVHAPLNHVTPGVQPHSHTQACGSSM
jgi:hypothetical protein